MGAENRGSVFCRGAEADPSVVFYGPGNRRTGAQRSLRSRFPVASLLRPGEFGDDIRKPRGLSAAVLESTLVSFCMRGDPFSDCPQAGRAARARAEQLAVSALSCVDSCFVVWHPQPLWFVGCRVGIDFGLVLCVGAIRFGLPSGRAGRACSRRAVGCFGLMSECVAPLPLYVAYSGLPNRRMKCWVYFFFTSSIVGTG